MPRYLTKVEILKVNKLTIEKHGGNFVPPYNFSNKSALDYLLEAVKSEMFGTPLYPSIGDKAALYMFNINSNHIFQDGNKRTGLGAALLFLALNNSCLSKKLYRTEKQSFSEVFFQTVPSPNEILFQFTMDIALGNLNLEDCKDWFSKNITKNK